MDFEEFIKQHDGLMLIGEMYDLTPEQLKNIMVKAVADSIKSKCTMQFESRLEAEERYHNNPAVFTNTRSGE